MTPVLVTGAAGFIGYHLAARLLDEGQQVVGFDNLSSYYSIDLKRARIAELAKRGGFHFVHADLADDAAVNDLFERRRFRLVYNMAAQAGVRYSLQNPQAYVTSNVAGFVNLLEACRRNEVAHLVYASSSSVYGAVTKMPFSVHQNVDHPVSVYAATKKANELLAHSYSHIYRLPTTGLRFFTVYGPWGRPDMATYLFTQAILAGRPIEVFNNGEMQRDFTYIDDVVEALVRIGAKPAAPHPAWNSDAPDPAASSAPYRIYNIGNHSPVRLMKVIALLEQNLGQKAIMNMLPMQPGDVPATYADVADFAEAVGFEPKTPIEEGIRRFVDWYRGYHGV
jgi:UDP-glucuronate 4-epimerase